jgi:hypothetical protein
MPAARFVQYPRGRVYAVADTSEVVRTARAAVQLLARPFEVTVRSGADAANALDGTGARHGAVGRLVRLIQFGLMDQLPDLAWYEAALREGRFVLEVPAGGLEDARLLAATLETAGAHFINHFGRFQTAEFVRWRGPEPHVPGLMKR